MGRLSDLGTLQTGSPIDSANIIPVVQMGSVDSGGNIFTGGAYESVATLVTAQDLTASYADFGSEIDCDGFNRIGVYIIADVNNSENVTLRVLGKHTSAGADEYEVNGISEKTLWTTGASDFKIYYEFDVGTMPVIQLQAIAGTVGATAGDLTISIDKKWRD